MPRRSIVSKHFDRSSGSEEDLTLAARRVLQQRKRDQERRKKLGSLVPIDRSSFSGSSQPIEVTRLWEAVPLRTKRAETEVSKSHQDSGSEIGNCSINVWLTSHLLPTQFGRVKFQM